MKAACAALFTLTLVACSPSAEKIEEASKECEAFIAKEMNGRDLETKVFDTWTKDGAIVVEVGYKERSSSGSYSVRKCVYDEAKGRISSPSPLNDSQWSK